MVVQGYFHDENHSRENGDNSNASKYIFCGIGSEEIGKKVKMYKDGKEDQGGSSSSNNNNFLIPLLCSLDYL